MLSHQKKQLNQSIGICESDEHFCCVAFHHESPKVHWLPKKNLTKPLIPTIQTLLGMPKPRVIYATPYPFIWRKYLFFPIHYSSKMIYQQIIKYLNQTLPIHIDDIFFDYQIKNFPDNSATRVIIYAIKKEYVDKLTQKSNMILDCELFCFIRGIHYLKNEPLVNISDFYYQMENIYIHFKLDECFIHNKKPHNVIIHSLEQLKLTEDIIEPCIYIKALGACLWAGKA